MGIVYGAAPCLSGGWCRLPLERDMNAPGCVRLSLYAMATRFELALYGDDPIHLRAAGEEALEEIEHLNAQLSAHLSESEISWINARADKGPVKVEARLFQLIRQAIELRRMTEGAFDITVQPLLRAWGFFGGFGKLPDAEGLASARELTGPQHLLMDDSDPTLRFDRPGVAIDLGAIGKGYAIERAAESLRENGIASALIHGGTSTIYAIGSPPDAPAWRVGIRNPLATSAPLRTVDLRDTSLSVSAIHGKAFQDGHIEYGHIIDPRTGQSANHTLLAAVTGPSPTLSDALSTALLVLGASWLPEMPRRFPGYSGLAMDPTSVSDRLGL